MIDVHPAWAPIGAAHFRELVEDGFYDGCRFFRVIPDFMVQFGINGDPEVNSRWSREIIDDPVVTSNVRGMVTFAKTARPDSRSTQLFINYVNNGRLDRDGFAPFGKVLSGMDVIDSFNAQYRGDPSNAQQDIKTQGNTWLDRTYPGLDYITTATLIENQAAPAADDTLE